LFFAALDVLPVLLILVAFAACFAPGFGLVGLDVALLRCGMIDSNET